MDERERERLGQVDAERLARLQTVARLAGFTLGHKVGDGPLPNLSLVQAINNLQPGDLDPPSDAPN